MGPSVLFMCCLLPRVSPSSWPAVKWRLILYSWARVNICTCKKQQKKSASKLPLFPHLNFKGSLVSLSLSFERALATLLRNKVCSSPFSSAAPSWEQQLLPTPIPVCLCCLLPPHLECMDFSMIFQLCGADLHTTWNPHWCVGGDAA